jgi:hypothetical protein
VEGLPEGEKIRSLQIHNIFQSKIKIMPENDLVEKIATIAKAGAYDIMAAHQKELALTVARLTECLQNIVDTPGLPEPFRGYIEKVTGIKSDQ